VKTVVLLSGGLDSAVTLAGLVDDHDVYALTVDYGQRHVREIYSAGALAKYYDVDHRIVTLDPALFQGSALTGDADLPDGLSTRPDATYVPARNTVLLSLACAYAESIGARSVAIGANADDAAAYPDCRADYIAAFRDVVQQGTREHVWIVTPLMYLSKQQVRKLADELNVPVELTWSCYAGGDEPCGVCGACAGRTA
jgi:7-cyano-7-deazaguanine synthase